MKRDGLLSFPLTPFTADGTGIAVPTLRTHLADQLATGPAAMFVACGTGEFTSLSLEEYELVVRTAVEVAGGEVEVYAGAGGGSATAAGYARLARDAGADGILLLPPYLLEGPPAGLVAHVALVAAATELPVIIYHRANAVLDEAAAVSLLDIPTVVGIKDGRGDVDLALRLVTAVRSSGHPRADGFVFLNGLPTAELSAAAYRAIGIGAYSSAVLTFVPDIATAFHAALGAGDTARVNALLAAFYVPFARLRGRVPGYAVSLVKAGARMTGRQVGPVRPPLVDPGPTHERRLIEIIAAGRAALAELSR